MRYLLITFFLILSSCSKHSEHETVNPYDDVKDKAESYLQQIKEYDDETLYPDRCDRLTFISLSSSFVFSRSLSDYEWKSGEWHRDVNPCYSVNDSRSEISFDGLLGVLHHAYSHKDTALLDRLYNYGRDNDDVYGLGDRNLTYLPQVRIIIDDMRSNMLVSGFRLDGTHNQHLIALSAWLKLRYSGFLESHDLLILENLKSNPLIEALLVRVDNGDQSKAIEYLLGFPDTLPLETGWESWGGCSAWLYWFLVYSVIEGK